MKIEAGKYYKARDGRKVGPIKDYDDKAFHKASFGCGNWTYLENGKWAGSTKADDRDLISEWKDEESPIRTVTRREVVPGVYGKVCVNEKGDGTGLDYIQMLPSLDAEEIREAAHILNQIAEALEENGK